MSTLIQPTCIVIKKNRHCEDVLAHLMKIKQVNKTSTNLLDVRMAV